MELLVSPAAEPLSLEDREAINNLDKIVTKLYLRKKIGGGLSGARIWLADIEFVSSELFGGPHILKVQNADATKKEQKGYQSAVLSPKFANLMPKLIGEPVRLNKSRCVMIFAVSKGTLAEAATIDTLLQKEVSQVIPQLDGLVDALRPDVQPKSPGRGTPREALQNILGTLLIGQSSITARALSKLGVGSEAARLTFAGDTDILPNPIAYLENDALWGDDAEILWPVGPTHGDLNCQNIVCALRSKSGQITPDLIDYSNFRSDGYLLYDLAYLEFDLLLRILPSRDTKAHQHYYRLCRDLTQDTVLPDTLSGGAFVIPVRELLSPIRNYVQDYWIEKAGRPDDYYVAFWLAGMAVGLNYMRKASDIVETKLAFNFAARALANVLRRLSIDWTIHRQDYLISPITVSTPEFLSIDSESYQTLAALEQKLASKERLLNDLEMRKEDQQISIKTIAPETHREFSNTVKEITTTKREINEQHERITPPLHFKVSRKLSLITQSNIPLEQKFNVEVQLSNMGREVGKLEYSEGVSKGLVILQHDSASWSGDLQPGQTVTFNYDCYCSALGDAQIYTKKISYHGDTDGANDLPRTILHVIPAAPPPTNYSTLLLARKRRNQGVDSIPKSRRENCQAH